MPHILLIAENSEILARGNRIITQLLYSDENTRQKIKKLEEFTDHKEDRTPRVFVDRGDKNLV